MSTSKQRKQELSSIRKWTAVSVALIKVIFRGLDGPRMKSVVSTPGYKLLEATIGHGDGASLVRFRASNRELDCRFRMMDLVFSGSNGRYPRIGDNNSQERAYGKVLQGRSTTPGVHRARNDSVPKGFPIRTQGRSRGVDSRGKRENLPPCRDSRSVRLSAVR